MGRSRSLVNSSRRGSAGPLTPFSGRGIIAVLYGLSMKKTAVLIFLVAFAGLSFYFFFAEDYCHVHNRIPGGAFSHSHGRTDSICLCFWSTLFSPGSFDFDHYQGVQRFPVNPVGAPPLKAFDADISHPPRLLPA